MGFTLIESIFGRAKSGDGRDSEYQAVDGRGLQSVGRRILASLIN